MEKMQKFELLKRTVFFMIAVLILFPKSSLGQRDTINYSPFYVYMTETDFFRKKGTYFGRWREGVYQGGFVKCFQNGKKKRYHLGDLNIAGFHNGGERYIRVDKHLYGKFLYGYKDFFAVLLKSTAPAGYSSSPVNTYDIYTIWYKDNLNNLWTTDVEEILTKNISSYRTDYIHQRDTTAKKVWKKEKAYIGLDYFKLFCKDKVFEENIKTQNSKIEAELLKNGVDKLPKEKLLSFQFYAYKKNNANSLNEKLTKLGYTAKVIAPTDGSMEFIVSGVTNKILANTNNIEKWIQQMSEIVKDYNASFDSWAIAAD